MKTGVYFLIMTALLLSACGSPQTPEVSMIQTAIAQTMDANPTDTVVPTATNSPTITPTDTNTPSPTATETFTPTPKPTKTSTATPLPPETLTAEAVIAQKTQASLDKTATQDAKFSQRTATAESIAARATLVAKYQPIAGKELVSYANQHKGELVVIKGRVFNIAGTKEFQMYYGWTYDAVFVKTKQTYSGLYEDNYITVYGEVDGEECFTNAYNAEICQPLIINAWFEK